jgi:hypothetical protein
MLPLSLFQDHATQRMDAALQEAARRRQRRAAIEHRRRDAAEVLGALLHAAAATPLDETLAWANVRRRAALHTARLADDGRLPRHLVVDLEDPPVVVNRTITAAWRHLHR